MPNAALLSPRGSRLLLHASRGPRSLLRPLPAGKNRLRPVTLFHWKLLASAADRLRDPFSTGTSELLGYAAPLFGHAVESIGHASWLVVCVSLCACGILSIPLMRDLGGE